MCFCRVTESANKYFLKQRRLGYGRSTGLSSVLVGTWDSMFDTRPPPYRVLHRTPSSDVYHGKTRLVLFEVEVVIMLSLFIFKSLIEYGRRKGVYNFYAWYIALLFLKLLLQLLLKL